MTKLLTDRLDEIERVCKAARKGPWKVFPDLHIESVPLNRVIINYAGFWDMGDLPDAEFIAQSRTVTEQLVKSLRLAVGELSKVMFDRGTNAGSTNANNYTTAREALTAIEALMTEGGK